MVGSIALTLLPRTNPTLWSHMRLCALRGALASSREVDRWVLHDPRAWLGTACHPLDIRFADPERWPGYYLTRQRALASAAEIVIRASARVARARPGLGDGARGAERRLEARGGRLAGRPDHFDGHTVTEYKSSLPDPAWPGAEEVLDGFRRQLRLYAAIIAEVTGRCPTQGRVVAASGQAIDIPLVPAACEAEATAALTALDALNEGLASGVAPEALARPASAACGACPFQTLCPAFWRWLGGVAPPNFSDVSAEGILERSELGQDGDLYTAYLLLRSATHPLSPQQAIVLRRSIHGDLTASPPGALLRVVSAKVRPDGRARADLSTTVFVLDDIPVLVTGSGTAGPSARARDA
jgi:hypothetical protein